MPAIPAVGTTYDLGGFSQVDNRFYDRGGLCAVLIRDNRGASTSIAPFTAGSPPTRNFSPFSLDGNLRSDLFIVSLVNGVWVTNTSPNQGFWLIGAIDEKSGPDRKPAIKHDDAMILQSNFPFDTDITSEGITITFTPVEPLKPTSMVYVDRQIILIFARRKAGGLFLYTAEGYSLCRLTDIGNVKRDKTNADSGPLGFTV